jgi:hypothetical protein
MRLGLVLGRAVEVGAYKCAVGLNIDADAALSAAFPFQRFQVVSRRYGQIS